MPRRPERRAALALGLLLPVAASAEPAREAERGGSGGGLFDVGQMARSKEPITVTSDTLEYDYKANVVVYRGGVLATQGPVKLRSDTLTVTFAARDGSTPKAAPVADTEKDAPKLRDIIAVGGVRIDHGTRWATGGRAVFDQTKRTLVLTEEPVLHDGTNEVAGDRVVVYLDEDRSVVEGGRKRVKAVLHPDKDGGLAPAGGGQAPGSDGKRPTDSDATARATTP